jgi:hypothetical protein
MANYRRELSKNEQKNIHFKYKDHVNAEAGIFTSDKRKKLLGVKQKSGSYHEDTADFWYDVRTHTKSGLKDLEILAEVAHHDQLKEIFQSNLTDETIKKMKETEDENMKYLIQQTNPTLDNVFRFILESRSSVKIEKEPWNNDKLKEQEDAWKYYLTRDMIRVCFEFLKNNRYITSKSHERLVEEVLDMIDSEAHNTRIPPFWRLNRGFV